MQNLYSKSQLNHLIISTHGVYRELTLKIIAKACSSYHLQESIGNSHSMQSMMKIINHVNSFSSKHKIFMNMHNIRKSWEHIKHMILKHRTSQEEIITLSQIQSRRKKYGYWDIISALTSKQHPARYDFLHSALHTQLLVS